MNKQIYKMLALFLTLITLLSCNISNEEKDPIVLNNKAVDYLLDKEWEKAQSYLEKAKKYGSKTRVSGYMTVTIRHNINGKLTKFEAYPI